MSKLYFIAKKGHTAGPYSQLEIEALRESGRYETFSWVCNNITRQWQPIDPAPALLPFSPDAPTTPVHSCANAPVGNGQKMNVICHNDREILSGTLIQITDAGCELVSTTPCASPKFQSKLPVLLQIYNEASGQSMDVRAKMGQIERRGQHWHYRIHWKNCPELLKE